MNLLFSLSGALPPLLWVLFSGVLFATFDVFMRFWYEQTNNLYFIAGLFIGTLGLFFLSMSFPHQNIAVAVIVSILINITFYLLAAYLIYGDIISYREGIGLLLGFIAIYVLEGMK